MRILSLLLMFFAASATPAFTQIVWNNQTPAGLTDGVWSVTYANGSFAAVTDQGKVLTSTDAYSWSSQTVAAGTWLVSIAYGNGKWVAVGAGGTILVSSDLRNWVSATAVTYQRLNGVLYNGGVWVAVGEAATVVTSLDALNWTVQHIPASFGIAGFLHGVTWDPVNAVFLISGQRAATVPVDIGGQGVMLQLSFSGGSAAFSIDIYPADPLEAVLYESMASPNTVAVGGSGLILSGNYAGPAATTGAVPVVDYRGLAYGNGYWIAAGEQGTIVSSTDGVTWTQRFSGSSPATLSTQTLLSAAYSGALQRFVVTGGGGTILVSNSTPSVFENVSASGYVSSTQVLTGGFVIGGTGPRTVLIRADGPVLATLGVPNALPDPVVTVYSAGVAIATNTGWTNNPTPSAISTAALEVGAFPLPNSSGDSALLLTLQPGAYSFQITSARGNSGTALLEAYTN